MIEADRYTPVDSTLIPTGELAPVEGTPFDFRKATAIGARIDQAERAAEERRRLRSQLGVERGRARAASLRRGSSSRRAAARWRCRPPSRACSSTQAISSTGRSSARAGASYQRRSGLCLETQHFPDSPNQPKFPSTILRPGGAYESQTVFTFGVAK